MMRHFEGNISDLSHHQIKMLWLSKSLLLSFIIVNAFSQSMHEASLIEEMGQFMKETRTNKDILNFENYESVLKDFETYPIVSSTEKNSSWCEVTGSQHNIFLKIFKNSFQGIQLINQIRDVNGKLYSKVSLSHPEDTLIVRDTGTQIVHHHPRMYGLHWLRIILIQLDIIYYNIF